MENRFDIIEDFQKFIEGNKKFYNMALRRVQANTYQIGEIINLAREIWIRHFKVVFTHKKTDNVISCSDDGVLTIGTEHESLTEWTLESMLRKNFDLVRMSEYSFVIISEMTNRLYDYDKRNPDELNFKKNIGV